MWVDLASQVLLSGFSSLNHRERAFEGSEERRQRGVFYGWWLVGLVGLVMVAATVPWSLHAMPVWVVALAQDFSWGVVGRELTQALYILIIGGLLLGPVVGYLGDRVMGIRRTVVAGLVILAGAFFLFSQTQNLWMYYAASMLMAVGATMSGWIPLMTVLSRWFVRRRATALGVAQMFSPLGIIFLVSLIAASEDPDVYRLGWRLAAIVVAGSIMVVAVLAFARLRNRPEDMGLLPDGGPPAVRQDNFSVFQALRTRPFWLIACGDGLAAVNIPDLTDTALTLVLSAATLSFALVGGLVGDRVPKSVALASFTALQVVAWAAAAFAGSQPALYLSAVVLGISRGGRSPLRVAILADYFGTNSLATILGLFGFFAGLTGFTSALGGLIYYTQGSIVGFLTLSGLTLLGAFAFLNACAPQSPDTVAA